MSQEPSEEQAEGTESHEQNDSVERTQATSPVKVVSELGEEGIGILVADGGQSDAKVIGHNTDGSGQTVGVWGEVDSPDGCGVATPDDVRIEGTVDTNETDFVVGAGTTNTVDAQNIVMGHASNTATSGAVGSVIGGGGKDSTPNKVSANYATVSGGRDNVASGAYATVSGGQYNETSSKAATVGGGQNNNASGSYGTISGGIDNDASGAYSIIPGGTGNSTTADNAFAGGTNASADHKGAFIWSDTSSGGLSSLNQNEFAVSAAGGVFFFSNSDATTGVELPSGSGSWSSVSTETLKSDLAPVDGQEVLDRVADLDVTTWSYDAEDEAVRHMGPMAEDFYEAFELGTDPEHISTVDADGVALAAIQGLSQKLEEKDERIEDLEAENEQLRKRLETIEGHLGLETGNDQALPADD